MKVTSLFATSHALLTARQKSRLNKHTKQADTGLNLTRFHKVAA